MRNVPTMTNDGDDDAGFAIGPAHGSAVRAFSLSPLCGER